MTSLPLRKYLKIKYIWRDIQELEDDISTIEVFNDIDLLIRFTKLDMLKTEIMEVLQLEQ